MKRSKRRGLLVVAVTAAILAGVPAARACLGESTVGPQGAGSGLDALFGRLSERALLLDDSAFTSPNVEFIAHVADSGPTATGGRLVGHYFYVTSWRDFAIYDVADPLHPKLMSRVPVDFRFENEDVSTNGKILLFSDFATTRTLYVYDVRDKANPTLLSQLDGLGTHTASCLYGCDWVYGSYHLVGPDATGPNRGGQIVDLRDPAHPKDAGDWTAEALPSRNNHDVTEVRPGFVLTASDPMLLLDTRDVDHPKVLAKGTNDGERLHTVDWPNHGRDRFIMSMFETNGTPRCEASGEFSTWDATEWRETGKFERLDSFYLSNGTFTDGDPAVSGPLGCSPHWFQPRPGFKNGGIVAMGSYDSGTKFLNISPTGEITEVGHALPDHASTSAAYWITKNVVYTVDYARGIDILRFNG
jgi:hypothetical protein